MPPKVFKSQLCFAEFKEVRDDNGALTHRRCNHCGQKYAASSSSTTLGDHLNEKHTHWKLPKQEPLAAAASSASGLPAEEDIQMVDAPNAAASSSSASVTSHSESFKSPPRPRAPPSIADLLASQGHQSALQQAAVAFAMNGIAHRVVQTPSFSALLTMVGWRGALPTRRAIRTALLSHATALRTHLITRLRNSQTPVTLAVDGWTNVRHDKVTNVLLLQGGQAFYWCSITNDAESNTADWLAARIRPVLDTLTREHQVRVVALVADNEAVMGALHDRLEPHFPFLIRVPCAAHTLQLAVRDCLASEEHAQTVTEFLSFVKHFEKKEHRLALRDLQRARKVTQLVLRKPNDTRWNSLFLAIERALEMQPELECCMPPHLHQQRDDFFTRLTALRDFLHPFRTATDVVQRDSATLSDVMAQFIKLLAHVRQSDFSSDAVLQRWQEFVNRDAVTACCILSFAPVPADHSVQSALEFIRTFGTQYLTFYGLSGHDSAVLSARLWQQIGDFNLRDGAFTTLPQHIEAARSIARADPGGFNPRRVWAQYALDGLELPAVALALLSIAPSEAAVERSFSAQDAVHTKKRNRLGKDSVQAEMFVRFNHDALLRAQQLTSPTALLELDEGYCSSDADTEVDISALFVPRRAAEKQRKRLRQEDEVVEVAVAAAAAAPASSPPPAAHPPARTHSATQRQIDEWLWSYIEEHSITHEYHWTREAKNALEAASLNRPRDSVPLPMAKQLLARLRTLVNPSESE
jgi:hypothetical protein